MRATFKLINSYFWKTIYGPIIAFVFPLLLLGILGATMKIQYVYPGIIALAFLLIGTLALPLAIMELKVSSLFKYIGSSPVNSLRFSVVVIFYYIFIAIITGFVIMFGAMIIFPTDVFPKNGFGQGILGGLSSANGFFSFYAATLIHLILVISVGLSISTFAKTPQQALTISVIIIIPTIFISGMVISVDIISQSDLMQWVSRFVPFRYSTGNIVVATTPPPQLGDIYHLISPENRELIFGSNVITEARIADWANQIKGININISFQEIVNTRPELKEYLETIQPKLQDYIDNFEKYARANIGNIIIFNYEDSETWAPYKIIRNTNEILSTYKSLITFGKETDTNEAMRLFDPGASIGKLFSSNSSSYKLGDKTLFNLIFLKPSVYAASDNNIFNLEQSWSVRKPPDVSQMNDFIQDYLKGGKQRIDIIRFQNILDSINNDDFGFMDVFLKQNNVLYVVADRSLNIFVPLIISAALLLYVRKKFSWSSR